LQVISVKKLTGSVNRNRLMEERKTGRKDENDHS
jgi:hypothetical protein